MTPTSRLLTALASLWICGHAALAAEPAPDLLLVTVDTLRADALASYGNEEIKTPTFDRLAAEGVLFEDVITTIGKTGPAAASLFTSLYPPTHGARRNGVPLRPDVPTLAARLDEAGYLTAAFITNWTLRSRLAAVDRGFDHYDEEFNSKRHLFGAAERGAEAVNEAALAWLKDHRTSDQPIFLWVHFSEPHTPYDRQRGFEIPRPTERGYGWQRRWRYASEVGYVDHHVGALLAGVDELRDRERITIFTADHGESLGEHDYWGHGKNTYWPNLQIPLILTGSSIPAGIRVEDPASIVDVFPTVLELLELEPLAVSEGASLVRSWQGGLPASRPRYAFADRGAALGEEGRTEYEHPLEITVLKDEVKAVYDFSRRQARFFDLRQDPRESDPLSRPPKTAEEPLHRLLASWYRDLPKYASAAGELSEEDLEQLKALGYVDAP